MLGNNDKHIQTIDWVYATALLDLAEEAGQAEDINEQVRDLAKLLDSEAGLGPLLGSHILSADQRAGVIEKIFKGKVSDLLYRFIQVVNEKGRLGELPRTFEAFVERYEERRGVVEVDAHVASPLDPAQAERVAERLGQAIGRKVLLHQHQDTSLIGGLKVRIADRLIDGSVSAQLRILKQKMIDSGREKAHQQAANA